MAEATNGSANKRSLEQQYNNDPATNNKRANIGRKLLPVTLLSGFLGYDICIF